MNTFLRIGLGAGLGYLAGAVLTDPTFGAFPSTGKACGPGLFGDSGPCEPGLVCQKKLFGGTCVPPSEVTTRKAAHAGFVIGGALLGYVL